ncbi:MULTISPECIES: hypothetical protein [Synechocystis]|uniref:Uncharacterized protein n=1 Tax=Synechocystis salina LEGE 00031 TaxID=1828736 RepID=A0ABR9VQS8_9SYNC|nr:MULTISPECIES: hypothetical protein [Synechocystis]MBE9196396.1 hypothetical protein [Synechocystis sp. LEGE 06083]MBE9240189.1 hypothetical protein [Synechocystis salina LEGE 00041]MBE9253699.1 hypothetical protein [Synechocystis salina LEGE 00031]
MSNQLGLWIDHKKAVIVSIAETEEKIKEILSDVETQPRRSGDSPMKGSYEALQVPADDSQQNTLTQDFNTYYDELIDYIRNAESIFIFGPSSAKNELKQCLEANNLGAKVIGMETSDSMTNPQIVAKVRDFFAD